MFKGVFYSFYLRVKLQRLCFEEMLIQLIIEFQLNIKLSLFFGFQKGEMNIFFVVIQVLICQFLEKGKYMQ